MKVPYSAGIYVPIWIYKILFEIYLSLFAWYIEGMLHTVAWFNIIIITLSGNNGYMYTEGIGRRPQGIIGMSLKGYI